MPVVTPAVATAPKTAEPTFKTKIRIKVFSPFKPFYDGEAYSLLAENDTGPFDILAGHHNFLFSSLNPGRSLFVTIKENRVSL